MHARTLLSIALALVSFGFILIRVRVQCNLIEFQRRKWSQSRSRHLERRAHGRKGKRAYALAFGGLLDLRFQGNGRLKISVRCSALTYGPFILFYSMTPLFSFLTLLSIDKIADPRPRPQLHVAVITHHKRRIA